MGPHADSGTATVAIDPNALRPARPPEVVAVADIHPDDVFWSVARNPYPVYLWGDGEGDKGRFSMVAHSPFAVLTAWHDRTLLSSDQGTWSLEGSALQHLESLVSGFQGTTDYLPFMGGAIGYISYEFACRALGGVQRVGPLPELCFALYDAAYVFDHHLEKGFWVGRQDEVTSAGRGRLHLKLSDWIPSVTHEQYLNHVERILGHIAEGDLYQANYTRRLECEGTVDGPALALEFRRSLPSPLGAYLGFGENQIWSLSPERLLAGRRGGQLESRPIKGTRPRDPVPMRDLALSLELYENSKERAELLMIVDLVRNDLGRVASSGSVKVDELYGRRTFSNVHHLEAVIRSDFPAERSWVDALAALLPGGSVTGTPKRRAVGLLSLLETAPRSVYTGALGYLSWHGRGDFNLPIRTLYHDGRSFYVHSGGGVVADSRPQAEFEESELKIGHILELLRSHSAPV